MDNRLNFVRRSDWGSCRLWHLLSGAGSESVQQADLDTLPIVHYSLASRLNETRNRPSGFDYIQFILALCVILSHTKLLTNDNDDFFFTSEILAAFFAIILPMFFALGGFLLFGGLELSNTLIIFLRLRVFFRIMPALTVEVLLSSEEMHYRLSEVFLYNPLTLVNGQLLSLVPKPRRVPA
jgi:hypothetical protein